MNEFYDARSTWYLDCGVLPVLEVLWPVRCSEYQPDSYVHL